MLGLLLSRRNRSNKYPRLIVGSFSSKDRAFSLNEGTFWSGEHPFSSFYMFFDGFWQIFMRSKVILAKLNGRWEEVVEFSSEVVRSG